jgi:predicted RNase H-like HicB family nuclease
MAGIWYARAAVTGTSNIQRNRVEKGATSYGAYVPDLPGCVAAAETRGEVLQLIREAIEFHIEAMREDGLAVPEPSSSAEYVEVALV